MASGFIYQAQDPGGLSWEQPVLLDTQGIAPSEQHMRMRSHESGLLSYEYLSQDAERIVIQTEFLQ